MEFDYLVDAQGEACPMPLLRAKMQLNKMAVGECVKVLATDAGSVRDFKSFIELAGHSLSEAHPAPDQFVYFITKNK